MRRDDAAPGPVLPTGLTSAVGGPSGRRLRTPDAGPLAALAPAVLLLALPLSVAALRQAGCLADGWRGGTPLWRQCGSPLVESVPAAGLGRGLTAYLSGVVRLDEPVLTGAVTAALAGLSPGSGTDEQRWFLYLWMLLAAVLLVGLVLVVGTVARHPRADPVVLALSPVLALTVLLSADLVPVALVVAAVWAWSRDRHLAAGALAGLAISGAALAGVVLLAMAVVPGPGGARAVRRLLAAAAGSVLGIGLLVALADPGTVTRPVAAWLRDGAGPGSPWYLATLAGRPLDPTVVALGAAVGALVAAGLVLALARRRPQPVVAAVVVVGLVVLMVTGPALPPSAGIWLVPFLALVGLAWSDHLLWAGAEVVHAVALSAYLAAAADPAHGLPAGWYALALLLRLLALGWVAVRVSGSWADAGAAGTLAWLPSRRPVENHGGPVGSSAYPPVTERP